MIQASRTFWVHPKWSPQAEPLCLSVCYSSALERCTHFPSENSAHQSQCLKTEVYLDRCRYARFTRYLCLRLTLVRKRPQISRNTEQSEAKLLFAKNEKEELSNTAVIHGIDIEGQRCSRKLANFGQFRARRATGFNFFGTKILSL